MSQLVASPSETVLLLGITNSIPPEYIKDALKLSSFRRALKLSLKDHIVAEDKIAEIFKTDGQEYQQKLMELNNQLAEEKDEKKKPKIESQIKELQKALKDLQEEVEKKITEYYESQKDPVTTTFDNEVVLSVKNSLSEAAPVLFSWSHKTKEGVVINSGYNNEQADKLFDLLDKIN